MLILLSPSKTQEIGAYNTAFTLPQFLDKTELLVKELQKLDHQSIVQLMEVSDKLAKSTKERFGAFTFPPQHENSCQALLAFRGDVFSEIEADNYSEADFAFAQEHLRILSGLYGILRPLDLIQPYRLEIGGKFRPTSDHTLYQFWSAAVTEAINTILIEQSNPLLLNLASNEYFKTVEQRKIKARIIKIAFKQKKNGKLRTVAIHAKKARGALANYIISKRITEITEITDFKYNNYSFAEELSSENELVFVQQAEIK